MRSVGRGAEGCEVAGVVVAAAFGEPGLQAGGGVVADLNEGLPHRVRDVGVSGCRGEGGEEFGDVVHVVDEGQDAGAALSVLSEDEVDEGVDVVAAGRGEDGCAGLFVGEVADEGGEGGFGGVGEASTSASAWDQIVLGGGVVDGSVVVGFGFAVR
ncbi:hypothetical protein [Nocardia sp. NPDC051981]|uniref:hypothetical protein n=1 Tax=Nocardia sp. NPDC051981 TaxID=3155417 RepID=UPI0034277704